MSALALLLAPGTAVAQQDTTPPSIVSVYTTTGTTNVDWVVIIFDENTPLSSKESFSVTLDGVPHAIDTVGRAGGAPFPRSVALKLVSRIPDGAVVRVFYNQPANPNHRLRDASNNEVESFGWNLATNMRLPTEAEVYAELEAYFSGTGTLGRVQGVIGQAEGKTYYEKLSDEVVSGRLDKRFDTDERSVVGTDGASGWHQVGTPSVRPGPSDTCGGTTVPGGEGGFETHVSSRYYWNCTQDGQWVPVKVPEPGVDYADDEDLLRPGQTGYNPECRHRDQDGNPATARRWVVTGSRFVRWNTWFDDDGNEVREEVREPVGHFVENEGNSWDKFAQQCTTRGNP